VTPATWRTGRAAIAAALAFQMAATATAPAARAQPGPGPWRSLIESNGMPAWKAYRADTIPSGWTVQAGVLSKSRPVGDIVSREEFGDFELELEWRIGKGGNSGIFYRGTEEYSHVYWSAPEYQLLDDANAADGKLRLTSAASNFALDSSPPGHLRPIGEWNRTRIVVRGAHVEHWLNGAKLVEYELWTPAWKAKVAASKFNAFPNFGLAKRGRLAIQGDHEGELAFRNIRIREWK